LFFSDFFQVFGLGNKTYEHYNEIGKLFDQKLEEYGGARVFELGLGDDDGRWSVLVFSLSPAHLLTQLCRMSPAWRRITLIGETGCGLLLLSALERQLIPTAPREPFLLTFFFPLRFSYISFLRLFPSVRQFALTHHAENSVVPDRVFKGQISKLPKAGALQT